jgi:hypothetical protein
VQLRVFLENRTVSVVAHSDLGAYLRYVMDELGSSIRHSDKPNFQIAPFMYLPDGTLQSAIRFELLLCSALDLLIDALTSIVLFLFLVFP